MRIFAFFQLSFSGVFIVPECADQSGLEGVPDAILAVVDACDVVVILRKRVVGPRSSSWARQAREFDQVGQMGIFSRIKSGMRDVVTVAQREEILGILTHLSSFLFV